MNVRDVLEFSQPLAAAEAVRITAQHTLTEEVCALAGNYIRHETTLIEGYYFMWDYDALCIITGYISILSIPAMAPHQPHQRGMHIPRDLYPLSSAS